MYSKVLITLPLAELKQSLATYMTRLSVTLSNLHYERYRDAISKAL